jgi:pimeloyl-ACP methyl ester carboxylesterase
VREFPVFVPFGEEHLAAVVAVPEGPPRGLVMLMPGGGGAPRSHRFAMWTKAARGLAERGIASIRLDWRGVGDSTGRARFGFRMLPTEGTMAMGRFGLRAVGTDVLGMAGNCGGARTLLQIAHLLPETRSACLILLKPLTGTRSQNPRVQDAKKRIRAIPLIGPAARALYWRARWRKADPLMDALRNLGQSTDLLLMESNTEKRGKLPQFVEKLQRKNSAHRIEIRELPGGSTRAFQDLDRQRFTIESVVRWFDETLPPALSPSESAAETSSRVAAPADRPA